MKKIIFTAIVAVVMCAITACESYDVRDGRELYRAYLQKTLIVPDDMKIYNESFDDSGASIVWTIDVGGTTRKNNHFRETMRFETVGGGILKVKSGKDAGRIFSRDDIMK